MIVLRGFLRSVDWLNTQFGKLGGWLLALLIVVITYDVICRYAFNSPNIWAFDIELQIWGVHFIMVAAWVELSGGNVKVDIFAQKWSRKTRAWIDVLLYMCVAVVFFGIVVWKGYDIAAFSWEKKELAPSVWAPPLYYIKATVPIFASMLVLQLLARVIRLWHYIITDKAEGVWEYL